MTELAPRHRILYVDYAYTALDALRGLLGQRAAPLRQLVRQSDPLTRLAVGPKGSEVHVWIPPITWPVNALPAAAHDALLDLNARRLLRGLRVVLRRLGMERPLVVNAFNPVLGLPLLGQLNEAATIYYCFDEISAEPWMARHGSRLEPEYLRRVDAVVTTSEALHAAKGAIQPRAFCVKNGANFDLFHEAVALRTAEKRSKTVVYLGTADNRLDVELLTYCAEKLPNITFQFIGPVNEPRLKAELGPLPNVIFTPPVRPEQLPPLLAQADAGMIPFRCNPHTATIYPLKINEYLAAGLPVVATPFANLDDFRGIIRLASTPEAFADALAQVLTHDTPAAAQRRVEVARANSWAHRAEEFEAVVERLL